MSAEQLSTSNILLVDDEMLVRAGTAMMLDELGHQVTEAGSGKEALQILAEQSDFDLIITDFRMPDMDGMELLFEGRKLIPGVRAILMTGYEPDDPRFAELQAVNLGKPFGMSELEQAISGAR